MLVWIVYRASESSSIDPKILMTVSSALFILPFFFFSTIAGELAAKYEKTILIQRTKWFEVFLVSLAIISVHFEFIYGMLSILFFLGIQAAFFGPMKYSILPQLVEREELIKANGWVEMGTFMAILIGTLLGSLVLSFEHEFLFFSLFMAASTLTGLFLSYRIPSTGPENPDQIVRYNFISQTVLQMIALKKDNRMFWMIQMISWFWLLGLVILTIIPLIAKDVLNEGETTVSILLTCMSLFIGIGSVTCHFVARKIRPVMISFGSTILVTVFLFILSFCETLPTYLIFLSTMSFFCGLFAVPLYTYLQGEHSVFLKSHLIAMLNIFNAMWMVMGSIALGFTLQTVSISGIFLGMSLLSVIQNVIFGIKLNDFLEVRSSS